MELIGSTGSFEFVLSQDGRPVIRYREDDPFVEMNGRKIPIQCESWRHWPLRFTLDTRRYDHRFNRFLFRKYSLHHTILCDGAPVGEIISQINSQILFYRTGGRLRLEIEEGTPFLEPLFYSIAWWWFGFYTDDTST